MWRDVSMGQFHGSRWSLGRGTCRWWFWSTYMDLKIWAATPYIYIYIYMWLYLCICISIYIYTRIWSSVLSNLTLISSPSPFTTDHHWPILTIGTDSIRWAPRRCWRKGPASRGCPRSSSPWPCSARPEHMGSMGSIKLSTGKTGVKPWSLHQKYH